MSLIGWILVGLIAGFVASHIVKSRGSGLLVDVFLGVVGAVVGGALFGFLDYPGAAVFNVWSLIVAVAGATLVLFAYHTLVTRRHA